MGCSASKHEAGTSVPLGAGHGMPPRQEDQHEERVQSIAAKANSLARAASELDWPEDYRSVLLGSTLLARDTLACLVEAEKETFAAETSSRACFLFTVDELVGPVPDRTWQDEWASLNVEAARLNGWDTDMAAREAGPGGKFSFETKLATYQNQIDFKRSQGWSQADAEAHVALSGVCTAAISAGLKDRSRRFAASTHALCGSLARACALAHHDVPPTVYAPIHGFNGLANQVDSRFETIATPDQHGFRGFTCHGEAFAYDSISEMFPGDGQPPLERRMVHGVLSYTPLPADCPSHDVIAFVSRGADDAGLHAAVKTTAEGSFRLPPNTLVMLKRFRPAGTWVLPNGVRPGCGCYEVIMTFAANPAEPLASAGEFDDANSKWLVTAASLHYADRRTYARGLAELDGTLPLTLAQEWIRDECAETSLRTRVPRGERPRRRGAAIMAQKVAVGRGTVARPLVSRSSPSRRTAVGSRTMARPSRPLQSMRTLSDLLARNRMDTKELCLLKRLRASATRAAEAARSPSSSRS